MAPSLGAERFGPGRSVGGLPWCHVPGDADIAVIGALLADGRRARILMALGDGRALPASVLAREAGVPAPTESEPLAKLVDACLLDVEPHGRHRYYRLAGPHVGELLETRARLAPAAEVRSLRGGARGQAGREARTGGPRGEHVLRPPGGTARPRADGRAARSRRARGRGRPLRSRYGSPRP